ncbi:phosphatase PAP2 family protein [Proteiniclasticum sp. C24MP]|uniref:phosphatase PAP2 family protein n=1 Tax=Proteiniclasticum sp. C24MP TaxID=3374101 RepID=UPI00375425D6
MNKDRVRKVAITFFLLFLGFGIIYASLALFSEISESVVNENIRVIDDAIVHFLMYFSSPFLQDALTLITEMGSVWFTAIVSFLIMLYLWFRGRDRWGILFYLIAMGGGGLLILLLKEFFRIERPSINEAIDAVGYSFPSGHAMGSMILYGFITYLVVRSALKKKAKLLLSVALMFLASLVAVSRVYLSAHYPSDVVAGQAGGLAWLMICIILLEGMQWKSRSGFMPAKGFRKLLDGVSGLFS